MRPLRRDTIASRDRFRLMGARQDLVMYSKEQYVTQPVICTRLDLMGRQGRFPFPTPFHLKGNQLIYHDCTKDP